MLQNSTPSASTTCHCVSPPVKFLPAPAFSSNNLDVLSEKSVPSVPSVIAATARRLHLQMYTYGSPFQVCIDTGADCSLLTERAYLHLNKLYNVPLVKEARVFQAAQGSPLNIIGSVTLPVSFHNHDLTFEVKFYVVTNFILQCDALLGYDELVKHDISIFPRYHAVSHKGFMHYACNSPVSILTVASPRVHFEVMSTCF